MKSTIVAAACTAASILQQVGPKAADRGEIKQAKAFVATR
jgi:hypothetical protein